MRSSAVLARRVGEGRISPPLSRIGERIGDASRDVSREEVGDVVTDVLVDPEREVVGEL